MNVFRDLWFGCMLLSAVACSAKKGVEYRDLYSPELAHNYVQLSQVYIGMSSAEFEQQNDLSKMEVTDPSSLDAIGERIEEIHEAVTTAEDIEDVEVNEDWEMPKITTIGDAKTYVYQEIKHNDIIGFTYQFIDKKLVQILIEYDASVDVLQQQRARQGEPQIQPNHWLVTVDNQPIHVWVHKQALVIGAAEQFPMPAPEVE